MNYLHLLALAAFLTWFSLMLAAVLRARSWTPQGRRLAFGNREDMPKPTPLAGRADRAARNLVDNLPIFICAVVIARFGGATPAAIAPGAHVFVWARVLYLAVYLVGIPYLRTVVYAISVTGIVMVAAHGLLH